MEDTNVSGIRAWIAIRQKRVMAQSVPRLFSWPRETGVSCAEGELESEPLDRAAVAFRRSTLIPRNGEFLEGG
jgi:hypothetical protein